MKIEESEKFIKLIPEEGMKITNKERNMFVDKVFLPINSDFSIYEEVGRDIWKYFVKEENPDITELQTQIQDINDNLDVIMNAVATVDEQSNSTIDVMLLAIDELYTMVSLLLEGGGE